MNYIKEPNHDREIRSKNDNICTAINFPIE